MLAHVTYGDGDSTAAMEAAAAVDYAAVSKHLEAARASTLYVAAPAEA